MTTALVIFLLFLLQFVYLPFGTSHFEIPKVYTAEGAIFILFIFFLFGKEKIHYQTFKRSTLYCIVILVVLTILDLIFLHTNTSFFGDDFRLQGIFLLWMLILFSVISATLSASKIKAWFPFIILCIQCLFTCIVAGSGARAVGTIGEPNALAADVIFLWPFVFFMKPQNNYYKAIAIFLIILIIFLTQSRSGVVALGIQLVFLFLSNKLHFSFKKTTIICLILMTLSLILPFFDQHGFYEDRTQVWQSALVSGGTHAIIGNGFGNTNYALQASKEQFSNNLGLSFVDSSHDIFLDWFVQGGIIGLAILVFFIYQSFSVFVKKKDILNSILLLGITTSLLFNPASIVTLVAFFWLIGKGMLVKNILSKKET